MPKISWRGIVTTIIIVWLCCGLVVTCFPSFTKSRLRAREAEVKSNIHAIQIALERYAVDTGGFYPYIIYGGDITDTFVHPHAPINPDTGISYYYPPHDPDYVPPPGDFDALIVYGYLAQYPHNPFTRDSDILKFGKSLTSPGENGFGLLELSTARTGSIRTNVWAFPNDRFTEYVQRIIGGQKGFSMWEVSEGQRHPPWPIIVVPDPDPHWTGYMNPTLTEYGKGKEIDYRGAHQHYLTPGNFYYYALFNGIGGYSSFNLDESGIPDPESPVIGNVIGFRLAGYGNVKNPGHDYYNLWGDYEENSLGTFNFEDQSEITIHPGESYERNTFSGPDGRPDGVIIVAGSGNSVVMHDISPWYVTPGSTPGEDFGAPVSTVKDEIKFATDPHPGEDDAVL